jgi:hypothetical protein
MDKVQKYNSFNSCEICFLDSDLVCDETQLCVVCIPGAKPALFICQALNLLHHERSILYVNSV